MNANLVLLKKKGDPKSIPLSNDITIIGRRHNCDLRIPLASVSKRHCQLSIQDNRLKVLDLGSRNGTFVNGKRIKEDTLKPGDIIELGPIQLGLQINGQPEKIHVTENQDTHKDKPIDMDDTEFSALETDGSGSFADIDLDELDNL